MKWISTLLLLVLALLLCAFVFFYARKQPTSEAAASREKRLFDFEESKIDWIELERDGTMARFEKDREKAGGEGWKMVKPIADRADRFLTDSLADRLARLETKRTFDAASPPPPDDQAGLAPPRVRIRFEAGKGPLTLLVGREVPGTGGVFLRIEGRGATYLVSRDLTSGLDRPLAEWRDRTLFDLSALDLGEATVLRRAGTLRFVRRGEEWRIVEPVDDEAAGSRVQSLLSSVLTLRVEAFHEPMEAASKAGLDRAKQRVRMARRGGGDAGELVLGESVDGSPERLYASVTTRPGIFEVNKRGLEELDADAATFRSLRLFNVSEMDARGMTVESKGEPLSFTKTDSEWKAASPSDLKPGPGVIEETLRLLVDLEADSIIGPARDLGSYGLDPPVARAEITTTVTAAAGGAHGAGSETGNASSPAKPGTVPAGVAEVVRFGKPAPGEGRIYAMRQGRPCILSAPASILDRFAANIYKEPASEKAPTK